MVKKYVLPTDIELNSKTSNDGVIPLDKNSPDVGKPPEGGGGGKVGGYNFFTAAFFMIAQMSGAGFLALPKSIAHAGWTGMVFIFVFCVSICFAATRLGRCFSILEERWPEYREGSRQPYQDMAYRAFGVWGRRACLFCVTCTLVGYTIVFMILIASMMSNLVPYFSQCQWVCIVAGCILPTLWLGTPKDFWQASVLAVVATIICVGVVDVQIILEYGKGTTHDPPVYGGPSIESFFLGFGAILYAYGGASVFPTIQNDMRKRSDFWKAAVLCFAVILAMYAPISFIGYYYIGDAVDSNVLLMVEPGVIIDIAIALEMINLVGTFIISFNPIAQAFEDIAGVPHAFGWQRVLLRTAIIVGEVIVALAVPNFGLVLNFIGGSTVTCLSFIFPPWMYMRLVDDKSEKHWPERTIPKWERIYLWAILLVGILGGISATVSALIEILNPESFGHSCFVHFYANEA